MKRLFLTDKEVALICEMSAVTVCRIAHGHKRKDALDITSAMNNIGGVRRWNAVKLASVLGLEVEDMMKRLS